MITLTRALQIWHHGKRVVEQLDQGNVVIPVPSWLAAGAMQWIWLQKVEHAGEKWAERVAEVTPEAWQASAMRHRLDGE